MLELQQVAGRKEKTGGVRLWCLGSDTQCRAAGLHLSQSSSANCSPPSSFSQFLSHKCPWVCLLFLSQLAPALQKNLCSKTKNVFDLCFLRGTLIWIGILVLNYTTLGSCMAPWPLDPSPVTSCKKMPGCAHGASAASLRMWCTSSLTKSSISLWGFNFPAPLLLLYYIVVIHLEKQGLQNISLRILFNPCW